MSIESITSNATDFMILRTMNLFDKTAVTAGTLNKWGETGASGSFSYSDYIPVKVGKTYKTTETYDVAFYNVGKTYVSGLTGQGTSFVAPAGAVFMRQMIINTHLNTAMVTEEIVPSKYYAFDTKELQMKSEQYRIDLIANMIKDSSYLSFMSTYSPLKGLKYAYLGDSITAGYGANNIGYGDIISAACGLTGVNHGLSGSRIIQSASETEAMCVRYLTMPDDADIVTVCGGTNDAGNFLTLGVMADRVKTTFYGACHVLFAGLIAKYPGKRIGVMTPLSKEIGSKTTTLTYVNAIKEVAAYYSLPVLDLWNAGGLDPNIAEIKTSFVPDGLHPNAAGQAVMARRILKFIESL